VGVNKHGGSESRIGALENPSQRQAINRDGGRLPVAATTMRQVTLGL